MIISVFVGWVTIGLFLVALPLAAWWVGGRSRFWRRAEARQVPELDLQQEMARRHGLRPVEAAQVASAVSWGRALDDQRLRAVAVDWARELVERERSRRAARPQLHVWLLVAGVLWTTSIVAFVVFAVAQDRWGDVNWGNVVVYLGIGLVGWRRRTGPERAIQRNIDPSPS